MKLAWRNVVPRTETLRFFFFLHPFHLCSRIPSNGHANFSVNWIISCTSNLSLIQFGENKYLSDNCLIYTIIRNAYGTYIILLKATIINKYQMNKKYEWNTEVTNFLNLQDDISLTTLISHNVLELISENAVFIIHMIKVERASVCFRVRRDNLKTQFPLHWNNVKFDMQYPVHRENDIRHDISFYRTFHPMVHRNALMRGLQTILPDVTFHNHIELLLYCWFIRY